MREISLNTEGWCFRLAGVAAAALISVGAFQGRAMATAFENRPSIAWQPASSDAEVDRAFALARQTGKPVFFYWGAVWCPPCNQVKATLFSRPDFVERSRAFVAVYVDGDKPGAQKVAARFKVAGYPSMVLFKADGSEITRLPGEVDPERYLLTLTTALNAQVPVKTLVERGLAGNPLTPEQWQLLAYYAWDTDEQQVLTTDELGVKLSELARTVPAELSAVRDRIALKAIAARAHSENASDKAANADGDRVLVEAILARDEAVQAQADLLVLHAERVLSYLTPAGETRAALALKWDAALGKALLAKPLTRADQIDALDARVSLWKFGERSEKLSAQRAQLVLREVLRIVGQTTDRYERQAVVPAGASVLASAGLLDESDALLQSELPRAVAPYYHMLGLAANAKERGDKSGALRWYEEAWHKSEGPATRLQWGAGYVRSVIQLTPDDSSRVAAAASAVISELEPRAETFFERNQRSLQRMAAQLAQWQGDDPVRGKVVTAIKAQLARTCGKLPAKNAGRENCVHVFASAKQAAPS